MASTVTVSMTSTGAAPTLLEHGHNHQALIPLKQAAALSPDSASIREAYGRALFHVQQYQDAADEFRAVTEKEPTNDFALFCLGRCLQQLGRHREARPPLTLAARLQPIAQRLPAVSRAGTQGDRSRMRRIPTARTTTPRSDGLIPALSRDLTLRRGGRLSGPGSRTPWC